MTAMPQEVAPPDGPVGRHWTMLPDGRVQCDVCPRECRLHEGQRGLCFVRARKGDAVVLTTYGRSSGFCIDPIEKKPLNHFLPGTPVLSFGTAGCNLTCKFCQNHDMSKARRMDALMDQASPEAIVDAAIRTGCRSLAYTYNDPVIFLEYALDTASLARERGLANVAVTAGWIKHAARAEFFARMDATNIDLKAFTAEFYRTLCSARLEEVKETIAYVRHETDCWLELTTLLIPGHNDSEAEVAKLSEWVLEALGPDVPIHFSAFHPDYRMLDVPRTPPETLIAAAATAKRIGLHHVYTGNIHHKPTDTTYCSGCGEKLIERDWYRLTGWALGQGGHCRSCGTALPGRFEDKPGVWGPRRQPVRLAPRPAPEDARP